MSIPKQLAQLKKLSNINPDAQWVHATKYAILWEITVQNRRRQANSRSIHFDGFRLFFANLAANTMPSLTKVVAFVLVVSVGSGFTMFAQASVPGEALWPIKRNIEEAELVLTTNPVKKTELHIKHINTRLDEIDQILKDGNITEDSSKTEKAIKQAVSHLEKDVVAVDNSLKIVKEEKDPVQVVALVEKVTTVAKETANNLDQKVSSTQSKEIEKVLTDAKKVNQDVKDSAVSLAVAVHEEVLNSAIKDLPANAAASTTPTTTALIAQGGAKAEEIKVVTEAVAKIVSTELQEVSKEVATVKDKVDNVDNKDINTLSQSPEVKAGSASAKDIVESIDGIKKHPEDIEANLNKAKDLLEKGNLKDSLEKIAQVKETYQQAETAIKKIQEAGEVNNASSTKPLIVPNPATSTTSTIKSIKSSNDSSDPDSVSNPDIKESDGVSTGEEFEGELFQ